MQPTTHRQIATSPDHHFSAYPPDVTFHDLIAANKRNSLLLMIGMGALTLAVSIAVVMLVALFMHHGDASRLDLSVLLWGVLIGLMIAGPACWWSFYSGAQTVLNLCGAEPMDKSADPELFNVVEEMSIAAGIPMPKVFIIQSEALNAFATGRDPEHAAVAITTGLRKKLSRDELSGVIAHEIAHIRHYDIRLTLLVTTLVGMIIVGSDVMRRMAFGGRYGRYGRRRGGGMIMLGGGGRSRSRGGSSGGGGGAAVAIGMLLIVLLLVFLMVIAPLLAKLIQFAVSRQREFLADAGAAELTRYPPGLIGALRKLAADDQPLDAASKATAHLFIVNPILNAKGKQELNSVFSTHPPIRDRILRLEALMR